jgi:hypothetical protein
MWGRFTSPALPGEPLTVEVRDGETGSAQYRTRSSDGRTVIDGGELTFDPT